MNLAARGSLNEFRDVSPKSSYPKGRNGCWSYCTNVNRYYGFHGCCRNRCCCVCCYVGRSKSNRSHPLIAGGFLPHNKKVFFMLLPIINLSTVTALFSAALTGFIAIWVVKKSISTFF